MVKTLFYLNLFNFCIAAVVFDPNNRFSMEILSMLNEAGVIRLQEIEAHTQHLQSIIKVKHIEANKGYNSLLRLWSEGHGSLHPTWRHLFWVLRELKLNHMADQLESHFHLLATDPEQENLKSEPSERSNTDEEGKLHIATITSKSGQISMPNAVCELMPKLRLWDSPYACT